MKRGFLGPSKKEPAGLCTIRKSTREVPIDTLQAAAIDSVHHQSIDTRQTTAIDRANQPSKNTVHPATVHLDTVHHGTIHTDTVLPMSIDTVHPPSIVTVHPPSIDTVHLPSIDTVHHDTVHHDTVHHDTVHSGTDHLNTVHSDIVNPVKNDTTCGESEKVEVLILKGAVIPDVIDVAEMNDFDLSRIKRRQCMPSSTRSNKDKHLLFSEDPAHLERTIRKDQRSTSLDAAAFTSTDSHTQPSTDTRPSSSTDLHRSTSIDTTPRTSIDHQSQNMVAIVILRQDQNGNLYDQDGHLRNATDDDFWQVVTHEKFGEGDFEVESSMSFGGSLWCRPMSMDAHRSTDHDEDRSTDYSNL
ncbi:hypothetical protein F2Q70_00035951 [Brassica cretica]|uniref:Uncharacterized protein n=1 Tax=Brassica cretica TaxID=69181 RepID=A0A8S9JXT1_BRACR|nr:hypothetical protein F2Q70_00035951 [Brassica cretica]